MEPVDVIERSTGVGRVVEPLGRGIAMMPKASSLAQLRRNHLARRRGIGDPRKQNIWVIRSFDCPRIVLVGDLRLDHFFFTEGDPSVATATYDSADNDQSPGYGAVGFDAIVTYRDGRRECRAVRALTADRSTPALEAQFQSCVSAAYRMAASYVEITAADLDRAQQRIRNWERLLAAYRRCAHRPLEMPEQRVLLGLARAGQVTFREMTAWFSDDEPALLAAAVARLLRKRKIVGDLDSATWSMNTRLRVAP